MADSIQSQTTFTGHVRMHSESVAHTESGFSDHKVEVTIPQFSASDPDSICEARLFGYASSATTATINAVGDGGTVALYTTSTLSVGDLVLVEIIFVYNSSDSSGHYYIKVFTESGPPSITHVIEHIGFVEDTTNDYTAQDTVVSIDIMDNVADRESLLWGSRGTA